MARKPSSKTARLIKSVLMVLLIVTASVGATLYYSLQQDGLPSWFSSKSKGSDAEAAPVPEPPVVINAKPIFAQLDPFTVTLSDGGRSRILYVAITLRVQDEDSRAMLIEFMPEVRDRVLQILARQSPMHVQTQEGRDALVDQLSSGLQQAYEPNPVAPRISNVLFTAFVIQ